MKNWMMLLGSAIFLLGTIPAQAQFNSEGKDLRKMISVTCPSEATVGIWIPTPNPSGFGGGGNIHKFDRLEVANEMNMDRIRPMTSIFCHYKDTEHYLHSGVSCKKSNVQVIGSTAKCK